MREIDCSDTFGFENPLNNLVEKTYFNQVKKEKSRILFKSMQKKNLWYKRFLSNPSPEKECAYKRYRSKWNHSVRTAQRLYYEKRVEQLKTNIKGTWSFLNDIVNRKRCNRRFTILFSDGLTTCFWPKTDNWLVLCLNRKYWSQFSWENFQCVKSPLNPFYGKTCWVLYFKGDWWARSHWHMVLTFFLGQQRVMIMFEWQQ